MVLQFTSPENDVFQLCANSQNYLYPKAILDSFSHAKAELLFKMGYLLE